MTTAVLKEEWKYQDQTAEVRYEQQATGFKDGWKPQDQTAEIIYENQAVGSNAPALTQA